MRELLALVDGHAGDDVRLAARAAEAQAMLGGAGGARRGRGGGRGAVRAGRGGVRRGGLPWFAVEYEARLAGLAHHLGDMAEAERALRAALEHGGPILEAIGRAQLHLQLAEVVGGRGQAEEAAEHALEAAHWADEAGEGPTLGAWARHQLGGFLLRQGRWAEAAEVLESALPDLSAETHGDGAVVQTQWWLGDCLSELGEHREAAERRLQAAEIARHWPEQHDHATLAHLAAESLGHAGLPAEADRAYARAGDLWRALGNVHGLVRSLRARAWLGAARREDGPDAARELMADAVRECEAALGAAGRRGGAAAARRRTRPHPPAVRRPARPFRAPRTPTTTRSGPRSRRRSPRYGGGRGVRLPRATTPCTAADRRRARRGLAGGRPGPPGGGGGTRACGARRAMTPHGRRRRRGRASGRDGAGRRAEAERCCRRREEPSRNARSGQAQAAECTAAGGVPLTRRRSAAARPAAAPVHDRVDGEVRLPHLRLQVVRDAPRAPRRRARG